MAESQTKEELKNFEVTVKKGEHGEKIDVIDVEAPSEPDANRKARERDGVFDVMTGCTVEYRTEENGGRVY